MFTFERLEVWHKSLDLADSIYRVTRSFLHEERFGLTSQMRRAVISISSNLAEGSSRFSKIDNARFVEIATGSLFEVVSQAFVAKRQGFLNEDYAALYSASEEQGRMLSGLRQSLLKSN
jgi:four helix bundle protein